ncbi:hypothetical protein Pfo_025680 [Paulownia fortunei]|nr:hypothetical protein Pfo_025680 [Paulownia fortunei]
MEKRDEIVAIAQGSKIIFQKVIYKDCLKICSYNKHVGHGMDEYFENGSKPRLVGKESKEDLRAKLTRKKEKVVSEHTGEEKQLSPTKTIVISKEVPIPINNLNYPNVLFGDNLIDELMPNFSKVPRGCGQPCPSHEVVMNPNLFCWKTKNRHNGAFISRTLLSLFVWFAIDRPDLRLPHSPALHFIHSSKLLLLSLLRNKI